jgi:hypothetical protein
MLELWEPGDQWGNNYTFVSGSPFDIVTGTVQAITTDYRFAPPPGLPGGCLSFGQNASVTRNLSSSQGTIIQLVGGKWAGFGNGVTGLIWTTKDSGIYQVTLAVNVAGQPQFYRGDGGGNSTTNPIGPAGPPGTFVPNAWYGLVIKVVILPSGGSVALYVNGSPAPVISATGLVTRASANSSANQVMLAAPNIGGGCKYDDVVILNGSGTFLNDIPQTEIRLIQKLASANGNYANWSPNGLAANWQNVSQKPPNTADYNANNNNGTKDSFVCPQAGLTATPYAVGVRSSLWKDDGATHTPSNMIRSGGQDAVGAALPALGSSPLIYDQVFENDPATGAHWLGPAADAAQPGVVSG